MSDLNNEKPFLLQRISTFTTINLEVVNWYLLHKVLDKNLHSKDIHGYAQNSL